jgi:hypothetical protein
VGGDQRELDELTRALKSEIAELPVDAVTGVSTSTSPQGAKAADWSQVGHLAVTLGPTVVPPFLELLKSWIARRHSAPVKMLIQVGGNSAYFEYDPAKMSPKELQKMISALERSLSGRPA